MTEHNLFYYPYASFTDAQLPLLKVAALYFDKLYILDPEKATGGTVGSGDHIKDIQLLRDEKILVSISPEEVIEKYEDHIANAIRTDLQDPEYIKLFDHFGGAGSWTLALAKVPKEIRDDPQHQEYLIRKPHDRAMQRLMGELPRSLASDTFQYIEGYEEISHWMTDGQFVYDELRESQGNVIEYRYADFPLPMGESIMMNHALFAGLLHTSATPLTDIPFHSQVFAHKLQRALQEPVIRQAMNDRVRKRQLKSGLLATTTLTDVQLNLPVLNPAIPLAEVLEYRQKHDAELRQVRNELGLMARRIEVEPWTEEFADELEKRTIPNIAKDLDKTRKALDDRLKGKSRLALTAAKLGVGAVIAVLAVAATPVTPIALVAAGLGLVSGTIIPGTEELLKWRDGEKTAKENGLHYLLTI